MKGYPETMHIHKPQTTALVFALFFAAYLVPGPCNAAEDQPYPPSRWEETIQDFEKADLSSPPEGRPILFIGSSSIRKWDLANAFPEFNTLNRGFGGSHIADSTAFIDRIVVPYHPRQIVFYAGDNDITNGLSPLTVRENFANFCQQVHEQLPEVPIIYVSIKTSHSRLAHMAKMEEANQLIEDFCAQSQLLTFLDVDHAMRGPDGLPRKDLFVEDQLHLSKEGYALWNKLLRPLLIPEPSNDR
jgi:lysophospholipase L1-like esterase